MPKMKTNAAARKRFKKTANGFKRKQAFKKHILTKMTRKRKRNLRGNAMVHESDLKEVKALLPGVS